VFLTFEKNHQRVSTPHYEFDIGQSERRIEEAEFDNDAVTFCFGVHGLNKAMRCYARLYDAETQAPLSGGDGDVEIEEEARDDKVYMSFSGFGYLDEQMTEPVRKVGYEVWVEGPETVRVTVYV
jgi:hypothetical protein